MARAQLYKKPGRPFELTEHDIDKIVAAYEKTLVLTNVCGLVGRVPETIRGWLAQGAIDYNAQENTLFAKLFVNVKIQVAKRVIELEKMLLSSKEGWQRFAWMLERTVRRDYSVYGEVFENIETQLNELIQKAVALDSPAPQEVSKELRGWLKDKLLESKISTDKHEQNR